MRRALARTGQGRIPMFVAFELASPGGNAFSERTQSNDAGARRVDRAVRTRGAEFGEEALEQRCRALLDFEIQVTRLPLPALLCRVLSTTNAIEDPNSTTRHVCRRFKHWCGGEMIVRWTCAAMREAEEKLRRVQGFKGEYRS